MFTAGARPATTTARFALWQIKSLRRRLGAVETTFAAGGRGEEVEHGGGGLSICGGLTYVLVTPLPLLVNTRGVFACLDERMEHISFPPVPSLLILMRYYISYSDARPCLCQARQTCHLYPQGVATGGRRREYAHSGRSAPRPRSSPPPFGPTRGHRLHCARAPSQGFDFADGRPWRWLSLALRLQSSWAN